MVCQFKVFLLDISLLLFRSSEQENKTAFFVDSFTKNKRLGKSLLQDLLTSFTEGGLEWGELTAGANATVWRAIAGLGERRQEARTDRLPARHKHIQT